jgi:sterol carrier protein 2
VTIQTKQFAASVERKCPMGRRVNVIGVGMIKFSKPGDSEDYHVMAGKAAKAALADAGVPYDKIEEA